MVGDTILIKDISINGNSNLDTASELSETLTNNTINALGIDASSRTIWVNGQPYGNAYVNVNGDTVEAPIGAEIFNDFEHNTASGAYSHAEGSETSATGAYSHAEGSETSAAGAYSHTEGKGTKTTNEAEHASGKYNISNTGSTIFSVGIGTSDIKRENAVEIMQNGDAYMIGIGGYNGKNINSATKLQDAVSNSVNITWEKLKDARDNGELVPGKQYRITDYVCTTTQKGTKAENNTFDIIVTADSPNTLNEEARAALHEEDIYFSNSNFTCDLNAWKIWYCLDNDIDRFSWADITNGRGVIYRMIDEFGNDCPYDFKNIQFYRQLNEDKQTWSVISSDTTGVPCYTFSSERKDSTNQFTDMSLIASNKIYSNVINVYINSNKQTLNNNCFFGSGCYSNKFENNCYNNTFGNSCSYNIVGNDYHNNILRNACNGNTFGNGCNNNVLGVGCYKNSFKNNCSYIKFADTSSAINKYTYYRYNSFGNGCQYILFKGKETAAVNVLVQNYNFTQGLKGTDSDYLIIDGKRNRTYETYISKDTKGVVKESVIAEELYKMIEIRYDDLCRLKTDGELIPGQQYRITDYDFTTTAGDTDSAHNLFDIIVTADSKSTLNENARATNHQYDTGAIKLYKTALNTYAGAVDFEEYFLLGGTVEVDGVTYYRYDKYDHNGAGPELINTGRYILLESIDLDSLNVSLDNPLHPVGGGTYTGNESGDYIINHTEDAIVAYENGIVAYKNGKVTISYTDPLSSRDLASWELKYTIENIYPSKTDGTGKGTILWMKDEFGNECNYDFINALFKVYKISNCSKSPSLVDTYAIKTDNSDITYGTEIKLVPTFGSNNRANIIKFGGDNTGVDYDLPYIVLGDDCYCNTFGENCYKNTLGNNCHSNIFETHCYDNIFGINCSYNSFGNDCYDNIFGINCTSNTFMDDCFSNSFGDRCTYNTFGNNCTSNRLGNGCVSNSFGNDCNKNSLGNDCYYNTFGNDFYDNIFGNDCQYNTFGNSCHSNSFGDGCASNSFGNDCNENSLMHNKEFANEFCQYNSFGNGCRNNSLGHNCSSNSFGNECTSNSFGNNCTSNTFGDECSFNSFVNGCISNNFENGGCSNNSFGNDCRNNSFGNNCTSNSFGNDCIDNKFVNNIHESRFGDGVQNFNITNIKITGQPSGDVITTNIDRLIVENGIKFVNAYLHNSPEDDLSCQDVRICQGCSGTSDTYNSIQIGNASTSQLIICYDSYGNEQRGNIGDLLAYISTI